MGVSLINKIAGWPAVRSYNFDVNGHGSIQTGYKAFFTCPLIVVICLISMYFGFPIFYSQTPITTNIQIKQLRPAFEYYSNKSDIVLNSAFSSIYKFVYPDFGFEPQEVDLTKTFENFGIQLLYGYDESLIDMGTYNVTNGTEIYFPHKDIPVPHAFFTLQGIKPAPPKYYWLPLFEGEMPNPKPDDPNNKVVIKGSLVNETGFINCTKLIERYNSDPRIIAAKA